MFRPRARLLRLLGEELISDEVVALTELVKNAHDADASAVRISFRKAADAGGEISVQDDGCGMDLETVLGVWMEPGATSKAGRGRRLTPRGRRVLGEKGVGRFAADKLARHLELVTRRPGEATEVRLLVDWDRFDTDSSLLADVRNRWETRPAQLISRQGTLLRMTGLRSPWSERMFRRLCTRLSRLRSPFRDRDSFAIHVVSDDFPQYSGELRADFLDRAPYRIEAAFDGDATIQTTVNAGATVRHRWSGTDDLRCGPVRVHIFAFDLETDAIARIGPRIEVRAWLREWSGISIYRDGFRIWPYGEPDDDWLRLDQRRVNAPVLRLSNNQVVGFVEISRELNPDLRDQTDREGLLHTRALDDLRRLLHFILQVLEAERHALRHPRARNRARTGTRDDHDVLTPDRRLLERYAELAAAGQAAALLSFTVQPLVRQMRQDLASLRELTNGSGTQATIGGIDAIATAILQHVTTLTFVHPEVRSSRRTIDVVAELERGRQAIQPLLDLLHVRMDISVRRTRLLRIEMRPDTFQHLVGILLKNALEWLRRVRNPRIRVTAGRRGDSCELLFSDNGPGIPSQIAHRIFEPHFSGKEGGDGMGLAVARTIVGLNHGQIELARRRGRRGTTIRLLLPRKRPRATPGAR